KLETLLGEGECIQIEKRGLPIAVLTGLHTNRQAIVPKPDFAARRKAIWGSRVFNEIEIAAMRAAELEDEEG
ncbi:MAG: Prevent-host-death protein, partial [Verrucomicrobiaceae bacterium]|nr:Prevent-host-death protein [Verrucomicrobiaceae bacterium]